MAGDHTGTSKNNLEVLKDLGLKQFRNTTIFTKNSKFILSPSVGNDSNWFDVRKVNLDKYTTGYSEGYLLIRLKEKFLIINLREFINKMIDEEKFSDTKNSGIHWQFIVHDPSGKNDEYRLISRLSKYEINLKLVDRVDLAKII